MTLSRDHAQPHALDESTPGRPGSPSPGTRRRPIPGIQAIAAAGVALVWVVAGLLLGADLLGFLLLAIPFAVVAQLVRRAPLRQLWSRDATTFARRRRGKAVVGGVLVLLVAAVVADKAGTWVNDGWKALAFLVLLLVGYAVSRRLFVAVAVAVGVVSAVGVILAPGLATTRSGDPVVLGHLAQQQGIGQLDGFQDLAVAEIDVNSAKPMRLAGVGATSNTPMEVGSISKVMTGLVIADAVRRGELHMGDAVSTYLPELSGSPAGGVTMRELVTHTAGYANFGPSVLRSAAWRAPLGLNFLGQRRAALMSDARHRHPRITRSLRLLQPRGRGLRPSPHAGRWDELLPAHGVTPVRPPWHDAHVRSDQPRSTRR